MKERLTVERTYDGRWYLRCRVCEAVVWFQVWPARNPYDPAEPWPA